MSVVDLAPMAVLASVFKEVGQFDEFYAVPGMPGYFFDYDIAVSSRTLAEI
jgi:hypothetical protein